jgi:4a-hydroxytetrahydrobiopterin dehydratase
MALLDDAQIAERLAALAGWTREGSLIRRQYAHADFKAAMAFVNRVAELAEAADHHPDIVVNYSRVTLSLTSHDAGGLTERDFRLAARIDGTTAG